MFEFRCLATTIGSLPHTDVARGTALMFKSVPHIPAWVQFPRRTFYENMMVQFTEGLPGLVEEGDRIYFDTAAPDFTDQLTDFYARYLSASEEGDLAALDTFGLSPQYAAGFGEFVACLAGQPSSPLPGQPSSRLPGQPSSPLPGQPSSRLPGQPSSPLPGQPSSRLPGGTEGGPPVMLKGQVTGPFTLGMNLLDQDGRCSYYDDQLRDVIVKAVALKAVWQIARLSPFGPPVAIFVDEPSLLGFGSQAFITVSRDDIVGDLNQVAAAIHTHGGLAGVHCEANTDWSLLMETDLDILDFDAYDHMQAITLYPAELRAFLDRGGSLGWGLVPTLSREAAATETIPSLLARFDAGADQLVRRGFDRDLLLRRALLTPSCGAGGVLTEPLAERVLRLLPELSALLRSQHGFDP